MKLAWLVLALALCGCSRQFDTVVPPAVAAKSGFTEEQREQIRRAIAGGNINPEGVRTDSVVLDVDRFPGSPGKGPIELWTVQMANGLIVRYFFRPGVNGALGEAFGATDPESLKVRLAPSELTQWRAMAMKLGVPSP